MSTIKCMMKSAFLIGLGIGGTIVYQKYNRPIRCEIEKLIDKTVRKVDENLEEMM